MRKQRKNLTYEGSTADKVIGWLEANPQTKSLTTVEITDMFIGKQPAQVAARLKHALMNGFLVRHGEKYRYSYSLPEQLL
jgi:L-alanine-DL-glutamate epimerase-like enolase superfamily enzyme